MPYIAYDLNALESAPHVARASGISDDAAVAGNARLWAWCWKTKTNVVCAGHLIGFYGSHRVAEAMVAFGFLEIVPDGYRVKGADKYLRISKGKSKGGHAAKSNLIPGAKHRTVSSADGEISREPAESLPIEPIGSPSALTSSIEHLASNKGTTSEGNDAAPTPPAEPPRITNPDSPAIQFFCWAQDTRTQAGLVREKPPHSSKVGAWFAEAMGGVGGDEDRLKEAFLAFGDDEYWQERNCPFAGFMAQWERYA